MNLSVVIPAFNEEEVISESLQRIYSVISELDIKFEVIVVKKIGQVWEDPGRTLQQSNGAVAKFLKDTETNFPEYPVE